jgi:hypothetical protein
MPARSHPRVDDAGEPDEVAERLEAVERELNETRTRVKALESALKTCARIIAPYVDRPK